jgi:hypothetical protein
MLSDYSRTFGKDILPVLRKQDGFKDEITFSSPGGTEVTAISLWDNKANAEAYNTNAYQKNGSANFRVEFPGIAMELHPVILSLMVIAQLVLLLSVITKH